MAKKTICPSCGHIFSKLTQGAEAGRSGRYGEDNIESSFKSFGVKIVDNHESYHGEMLIGRNDRLLIRQVPLQTNNGASRVDWVYRDYSRGHAVLIEHKHQMVSGSTDRKLIDALERASETDIQAVWLVLSGGKFSRTANVRADAKAKELSLRKNKRVRVLHNIEGVLYRAIRELVEDGVA